MRNLGDYCINHCIGKAADVELHAFMKIGFHFPIGESSHFSFVNKEKKILIKTMISLIALNDSMLLLKRHLPH